MKHCEKCHSSLREDGSHYQMTFCVTDEIKALREALDAYKAHVAELTSFVTKVRNECAKRASYHKGYHYQMVTDGCNAVLVKTPAQSLADIQAKAVMEALSECEYLPHEPANYLYDQLVGNTGCNHYDPDHTGFCIDCGSELRGEVK